jgi:hypothetical protein
MRCASPLSLPEVAMAKGRVQQYNLPCGAAIGPES